MRNRAKNQVTLTLIRHGETQANREGRYLGRTDEALSEIGRKTLLSYKEQGLYPDVNCLFTSPMKRCVETAGLLYPGQCPVVIPEWTEMDFGAFEYRNARELREDKRYQAWIDGGGVSAFPGGESREDFILRCGKGLARMCDELCRMTEENRDSSADEILRVGTIVHGGTIMALLSSYGEREYFDCQVSNGRGYVCVMDLRRGGIAPESVRIKIVGKL